MKAVLAAAFTALAALPAGALEVNQASQAELESVTGIGVDLATRIVAARQERAFEDWNDFTARVRGLGAARAARLSREGLTVRGLPYPPGAASGAAKPASVQAPVQSERGTGSD